jgi:hypothetical protein
MTDVHLGSTNALCGFRRPLLIAWLKYKDYPFCMPATSTSLLYGITERLCRTPASYSGGRGFKSRPYTGYPDSFPWLSAIFPGKCWDCTLNQATTNPHLFAPGSIHAGLWLVGLSPNHSRRSTLKCLANRLCQNFYSVRTFPDLFRGRHRYI